MFAGIEQQKYDKLQEYQMIAGYKITANLITESGDFIEIFREILKPLLYYKSLFL